LIRHPHLKDVPILLLANKKEIQEVKSTSEIHDYFSIGMDSRSFNIQAISSLNGEGVSNAVSWLCDTLKRFARTVQNNGL